MKEELKDLDIEKQFEMYMNDEILIDDLLEEVE